jgi:Domain of unknown function (DUF4263)
MPSDQRPAAVIRKQTARSGLVDYAEQVVLHDSREVRIVLVPFFISHKTHPPGLTLKLICQPKREANVVGPDKEINLDENASKRLLDELPHLAELAGQPTGDYLFVPIEGEFKIGNVSPDTVANSLLRVLSDPEIARQFAASRFDQTLLSALRSNLRLRGLSAAVAELRGYLSEKIGDEAIYQSWCRRHGWAFGITYQDPDEVRDIAVGDTVDFLLPTLIGYRDLVELKRPDMPLLMFDEKHRNYYWSRFTASAIGQCTRYLEQLQEMRLRDHPEIITHHPRATIVIGRSNDWGEQQFKALVSLNAQLIGITVMTFDLLLKQAERLLEIVTYSGQQGNDAEDSDWDVPF